jgi:hypothetical protein
MVVNFVHTVSERVSLWSLFTFLDNVKQSLWDAADYLIPPIVHSLLRFILKFVYFIQENNAFFIATRKTVTYNQTPGICPSVS